MKTGGRRLAIAFCVLAFAWLSEAAEMDPANAYFSLVLENSLPGQRSLHVHLTTRDGRPATAVGRAPRFSNVAAEVDCSKLKLEGAALKGELAVTLAFDGYMPPGGKPVSCLYQLEARLAGEKVSGAHQGRYGTGEAEEQKFAGALSGSIAPQPRRDGLQFIQLHMENAVDSKPFDKACWGRRAFPSFIYQDGRCAQALIWGHGGRAQINYLEGEVTGNEIQWEEDRFSGPITVKLSGSEGSYEYLFDGKVAGGQIGGRFTKKVNGKDAGSWPFCGTIRPWEVVPAENAIFYLQFHGPVNGRQLMAFAPCEKGVFGAGMAYAGKWNHTYHDLDAAGLKYENGVLKGEVKVTMNADPYIPPDHKPVPSQYTLEAKVENGLLDGKFEGTFGAQKTSGRLLGRLEPPPPIPEPVAIHVKLENGVCEGSPWFRRTYVGFTAVKGKAETGGVSNNKGGWTGKFKRAEAQFEGNKFTATIECVVETSNGPLKGNYTFKLTGKAIGGSLVGKVDTYLEGELKKQNTDFMGGFGPAKETPKETPAP